MPEAFERTVYHLSITLESPFLLPGIAQARLGIDASQLTNQDGCVMIPAEQIKGVLRQAFCDLADFAPDSNVDGDVLNELFGEPSADGATASPEDFNAPSDRKRGRLLFSDLVGPLIRDEKGNPLRSPPSGSGGGADLDDERTLTRIAIEDDTGSVKHGALVVVEHPFPIGEKVIFTGTLVAHCEKDYDLENWLNKAGALIPAIGSFKTAGFGRATSFKATRDAKPRPAVVPPATNSHRRVLAEFTFDRPLLVDAERISDNLFKSAEIIPGGVLKGALAQSLRWAGQAPEKDEALSRLVVGHAFPHLRGQETSYAEPLPSSLALYVFRAEGAEKDDALIGDCLVNDSAPWHENYGVGAFATDWKKGLDDIKGALGKVRPPLEDQYLLRVRTAIDPGSGTALGGHLFAYSTHRTNGLVWRCILDGADVSAEDFKRLLEHLGRGLDDVGKTGARATVRFVAAQEPPAATPLALANPVPRWALMLRTPALLNDPESLVQGTPIAKDYAHYWDKVSGGQVRYVTHFGRQKLAGGYQSLRFRRQAGEYQPWLLTQPGTVFLLEGDAAAWLGQHLRSGLPPHPDLRLDAGGRPAWTVCPYVPQNGYGAFCLNTVNHVALAEDPVHV